MEGSAFVLIKNKIKLLKIQVWTWIYIFLGTSEAFPSDLEKLE